MSSKRKEKKEAKDASKLIKKIDLYLWPAEEPEDYGELFQDFKAQFKAESGESSRSMWLSEILSYVEEQGFHVTDTVAFYSNRC